MISIVIPAHNEEKRIATTLEFYGIYFKRLKEKKCLDFEIIVVINNTQDKTPEIVKEYQKYYPEIRILNFKQGGKGFAVKEGFKDALKRNAEYIGFVDADMATLPEVFYDLYRNIDTYDGIIPIRWDKRSKATPHTLFRTIFSIGFNTIVRILFFFPFKDTQCGAKLFRRNVIENIVEDLGRSEWSFDIDLLFFAIRSGAKIKSIPTTWIDREGSHINLKRTPLGMFLSVVRLRLLYSPFKDFIKFYDKMPDSFKIHRKWR